MTGSPVDGTANGTMESEGTAVRDEKILLRVVLLVIFALVADLWARRHLGFGLENPVRLLGIAGTLTAVSGVVDWVVDTKEKQAWLASFRTWVRNTVLSTPFLAALYVIGLPLALIYSAVIVLPPNSGGRVTVSVTDIDGDESEAEEIALARADGPVRLLRQANPFGRDLRLSVSGYTTRVFTLYPLIGLTVDPDRDLQRLPSLLFRPSVNSLADLKDGGTFRLYLVRTNSEGNGSCDKIAEAKGAVPVHAFLTGTERSLPSADPVIWRLELQSRGIEGQTLAEAILAWSSPVAVTSTPAPRPGDRLYAEIRTRADKVSASVTVNVGQASFQDFLVEGVAANAPECGDA